MSAKRSGADADRVVRRHDKQVRPDRVRKLFTDIGTPQKMFIDPRHAHRTTRCRKDRLLLFRASLDWLTQGTHEQYKTAFRLRMLIGEDQIAHIQPFGAVVLVVAAAAMAQVQLGGLGRYMEHRPRLQPAPNMAYDGRFTFVRVSSATAPGRYWSHGRHRRAPATRSPSAT